jgi:hypothetical protein
MTIDPDWLICGAIFVAEGAAVLALVLFERWLSRRWDRR